jgi:O-antigen/teichoic acid export membrane protein
MIKTVYLKSEVAKNIILLTSGTAFSQIIAYILTPIITRLFSPDESAELGLYIRIVTAGAAIATARYELALPIIKLDQHSFRVYYFALRLTLFTSIAALLILLYPILFSKDFSRVFYYLSIPFGIALLAFHNLGTNWSIRMKLFKLISYSKVISSGVSNVLKVVFGLLHSGYIGLILGTIIGFIAGCFFFLKDFNARKTVYGITSRSPRNSVLAKQFIDFPKINLPHVLMDLTKELLIATIIWNLFSQREFGLYNHTFQMLRMPLVLIGTSIGQVFFQRCAEKINNGENVFKVATQSIKTLLIFSVIPFVLIFFFGNELFTIVFGEDWKEAGQYAEIMAPWFMFNFVASPISSLPLILKRQGSFFRLALFGSLLMICTLLIPRWLFNADMVLTLWITSICQAIYQIFVIYVILRFAKNWNNSN